MSVLPSINKRHLIFISSTDDPETKKYRLAAREIIESANSVISGNPLK